MENNNLIVNQGNSQKCTTFSSSVYLNSNGERIYMGYPDKSRQNIYIGSQKNTLNDLTLNNDNSNVTKNHNRVIYEGYPDKSKNCNNSSTYEKLNNISHFTYPKQKRGSVYTGSNNFTNTSVSTFNEVKNECIDTPVNVDKIKSATVNDTNNLNNENSNSFIETYDYSFKTLKFDIFKYTLIFSLFFGVLSIFTLFIFPQINLFFSITSIVLILINISKKVYNKMFLLFSIIISILSFISSIIYLVLHI